MAITSALIVAMFLMSSSVIVIAAARERPYEEVVMAGHNDKVANPLGHGAMQNLEILYHPENTGEVTSEPINSRCSVRSTSKSCP